VYSIENPPAGLKLSSSLAPWTSSSDIIAALAPQYNATLSVLRDFHSSSGATESDNQTRKTRQQTENMERDDMRLALEETLASLAETLCKVCVERATWHRMLAEDEQERVDAEEIWKQYLVKRGEWIKPLGTHFPSTNKATFGRSDKALDIAEIYRDYKSLVELCLERKDEEVNLDRVHERLEYYLMHYGEEFAFTLYNFYLQNRMSVTMSLTIEMYPELLQKFPHEKTSLSKFLQPQKYEKLRWIHQLSLSQYQDAGHTLQEIASHERRLRHKKLSLSIAKLSLLVAEPGATFSPEAEHVDIGLSAVNAQSQFIEDMVKPAVVNCIDNQARVDIALESLYLSKSLKKGHLRTRIVKRALEGLVDEKVVDAESMIDLLSLKKRGTRPSAETEFETYFWALQVLRASDVPPLRCN
jgi:nuclear pore complex protein Nup133